MTQSKKSGWRPTGLWPAVWLFVLTAMLFVRASGGDFLVYDDTTFVTKNPHVKTGLTFDNVRHAFTGLDAANWVPVTTMSHMLDCQIFDLTPWGHHLVSVLIHAINTAGLFLLLRKLTGAPWRSLIAAAIFGWHPLRVESVAWIAERKDVLSLSFLLLAIWAYARYTDSPKTKKFYGLCLLFFALGLMAKPMLVTFPFVLLLLDYWPLNRISNLRSQISKLILEKIPFFMLTIGDCVVTYLLQQRLGAMGSNLPCFVRANNALIAYARYLGKFFWPSHLAVLYPRYDRWTDVQLFLAGALVVGISILVVACRRNQRWLLFGWMWYLGTLIPVIGLVQVGEQSLADRFTLIPMIGIVIALVWGAYELTRRWPPQWWIAPLALLLCCYARLTWRQLGYWKNSQTLFEHTVQVTDGNYVADAILADIYQSHGERDKALEFIKESLRINPLYTPAADLFNPLRRDDEIKMGNELLTQGKITEALPHFQAAEAISPNFADTHNGLGVVYRNQGRMQDAINEFKESVRLMPTSSQARRNLANTLADAGQLEAAVAEFDAALKLRPDYFGAQYDMAETLARLGRRKECIEHLRLALQLRPGDPDTRRHLAEMEAAEHH